MLTPGTVIGGRYRLARLLGEGGMGVVWAATNVAIGREVAIKVLLPGVASEPTALQRFFNEAQICGGLRHPGIVDVLDLGEADDGAPFLVMELLEGEPLDGLLRRAGTLRPVDVLPVIRDVARTLDLAHRSHVVHRDVKPGNVFLHRQPTGTMVAKVLDFGVSKVLSGNRAATMTHTGTVVGSPAYMSPEQAAGRAELDARTDLYSLGVVLYEALSGRLPFLGDNYNALIIDIAVKNPPPISELVPGLPKPVIALVETMMAHDRDNRVASGEALAERVEATLAALGVSKSLPVPDPGTLASAPGSLRLGRGPAAAQTSSALATNAMRPRRSSPWVGIGIGAAVLVTGGAVLGVTMLRGHAPAAPAATAPADAPALVPATASASAPAVTTASLPAAATATDSPANSAASPSATATARKPGKRLPGRNPKDKVWGYD